MPATIDLSGRELGRYRVLQMLGAGGMGAVYEAIDGSLGRRVALKVLPPELVADARRVRRFEQEARTASALNHPHLIAVYDIGEQTVDGSPVHFIAMEKIDGTTLRATLAQGPWPLERALEVMIQIADAVAAAHGAGVVHRDLKPENVMLSRDGYAKVLDFGLAKLQDDTPFTHDAPTAVLSTQSGVVLGTPGYMSPEQAQGRPTDHRADIFALGCILYELASGRRAFKGTSVVDTMHRIVHADPDPLPAGPPELQRILRKALAKEPDDRYQSARDLSIDLRALLGEVRAHGVPRNRFAWPWMAAAAALLIVVAAIAIYVLRRPAPAPRAMQISRLTSSGDVTAAAISPDGKFLAYVTSNEAGQALWLRQLATQQDLQLVPPARVGFWGHAFTPDGNAIVYGLKDRGHQQGSYFRISTLGGTPQHLLDGIDSSPSFSPDGTRMAYVRADFPAPGQSALMVAASDGSGARALATQRYPMLFAPVFFTAPAWSPDGKIIACAVLRAEHAKETDLYAFDAATGSGRPLTDGQWYNLGQAVWMPDMSGVVISGARDADAPAQQRIYLIPYPSGKPRSLTTDLLGYRMPTITADGKSIVAVGSDFVTQVWRVPLTPDGGPPQKISSGHTDGLRGLACTPEGKAVMITLRGHSVEIDEMALDGTHRTPLTHSQYGAIFPAPFRGGLAFIGIGWTTTELRVMQYASGAERVVARGVDFASIAASPDGQWIAYKVNRRLWKVRSDGTGATQLTADAVNSAAFSPDGTRIALFYEDGRAQKLAVIPAAGGAPLWTMPIDYRNANGGVRWMPDASGLLVDDYAPDRSNLWKIPFQGQPQRLTSLENNLYAYDFDVTPDGKNAVITRGTQTRDAILIK